MILPTEVSTFLRAHNVKELHSTATMGLQTVNLQGASSFSNSYASGASLEMLIPLQALSILQDQKKQL
ncbi:hypothetical protein Ddye_002256 [Dipteronia dyeriana]|uniref:Uncharacterized protein n=1 Tax=Dipteronia dyeriana TaxID=168575 RepID=A0AAD9XQK3_9ROSI|nr:hypothetical protein Ddye_002256 [Dipteronia dyeriana]